MRLDQLAVDQRIIAAVTRVDSVGHAPEPFPILSLADFLSEVVAPTSLPTARFSSVPELFGVPALDLQRLSGLSRTDVQLLLSAAAATCRPHPAVSAVNYGGLASNLRLSVGCPVLDQLLRGGLPVGGVTELSGESAAGKTQLALQLCLSVQLPVQYRGLGSGAVYVCTEGSFPVTRLYQLISEQPRLRTDVPESVVTSLRFSDQIYVEHAADLDSLQACLSRRVPLLLARGLVRLVVLDSVAALFRSQFQADDWLERNRQILRLGAKLQQLTSDFNSVVLVINQVTDVFDSSNRTGPVMPQVVPALGLSWSNQVLIRLMMRRLQRSVHRGHQRSAVRQLVVEFAPHLSRGGQEAAVWREGVRGLVTVSHGQDET
ncbi:DNA repair protein XRCC3 isoform X2 [Cynoglossus semilaevis]|uniref:DNA repair protein XRCC3 isoform X2 n=1 Tax=Cynoglossus semilaevis TaxID=244447 RepID=UPI000D62A587|nr:DNA repair protein XRCC3 isoform X2 [Cynoglossus semilaevis]